MQQAPTTERLTVQQGVNSSTGSYELVCSAVLLGLIGFALDSWIGTRPLFTVIGACLGLLGATISIYFKYQHNMDRASEARAEMAAR